MYLCNSNCSLVRCRIINLLYKFFIRIVLFNFSSLLYTTAFILSKLISKKFSFETLYSNSKSSSGDNNKDRPFPLNVTSGLLKVKTKTTTNPIILQSARKIKQHIVLVHIGRQGKQIQHIKREQENRFVFSSLAKSVCTILW
ncbi:hypothetical protein BDF21DRAFT_430702 [Thamnidium elegans]|nr:hypothetical protein BDF21DRAFT_430702 [Thamnidium elegans]